MRILVTGGTGFLGRRVVDSAVAAGHQVVGLARSAVAAAELERRGARVVRGDLDDPDALGPAFRAARCEALVNIASLGFGHAETIVSATRGAGIRRAVFLSTTGIFTTLDPPSKRIRVAAERTIAASDLDWTIIRPTMIYGGPDDRNMCRLLALLRRLPVLPIPGGGHHLQQPVHVDDLAEAVLRALGTDVAIRRDYDIAGPRALTFREIVATTATAAGRRVICVPIPTRPVIAALSAYEGRVARPRLKAEQVARLTEDKAFDIDAARRDLDYHPRPFAAGIRAQAARPTSARPARGSRPTTAPRRSAGGPARTGGGRGVFGADQVTHLIADLVPDQIRDLVRGVRAIATVADPGVALRFTLALVRNAPTIARDGRLDAADRAMSGREWILRPLPEIRIIVAGSAFAEAREIYGQGVGTALPGYAPAPGEVVVDVGAGQGLFSVLAARLGADVIAVEARPGRPAAVADHAADNNVAHRIQVLCARLGPDAGTDGSADASVEVLTLTQVFEAGGVDSVDLVRLNLDGAAAALLRQPEGLDAIGRIVMTVRPAVDDLRALVELLRRRGFETALLDARLARTTDLAGAAPGFLYARRPTAVPRPRVTAGHEPARPGSPFDGTPSTGGAPGRTVPVGDAVGRPGQP